MSHLGHDFDLTRRANSSTIGAVEPKTHELLDLLLWSADRLARPTFRNFNDSYESWAYRNGFLKQVTRLEHRHLLERDPNLPDDRIFRLTEPGRLQALGGRDPPARWSRTWDGRWRLVVFDVPTTQNAQRKRLQRYLKEKNFGFLQQSVWITPDALEEERDVLVGGNLEVKSLILLEAQPCAGESDAAIVAAAWDFERINHLYAQHLKILEERPGGVLRKETAGQAFLSWATAEGEAWMDAVTCDPLLPERLLPPDYLGQQAWRRRIEALRKAGQQLRAFNPRFALS